MTADRLKKEKNSIREFMNAVKETEADYIGIEDSCDDNIDSSNTCDAEMPYDISNLRVEPKMITIFQMDHWITSGTLNLRPEYQRNLVWDERRKSALIESILLRIPIPSFYFDEKIDGKKNVIDGLQRLSTIYEYIHDGFQLKRMQYLSSCEKKRYSELDMKYQSYIMDFSLAVNIIDARCPMLVKFDIFRRVNTGGLPLNSQEIRNILSEEKVRVLLRNMSTCEEFVNATNGGVNDVRMGAQELCLRYITIYRCYDWEKRDLTEYSGLTKTMDKTILNLNELKEEELDIVYRRFKDAMRRAYLILGERSFCKKEQSKINAALFTSWAVVLTHEKEKPLFEEDKIDLYDRYWELLKEGTELYQAVTSSTGTRYNIVVAIEAIRSIF